MSDEKKIGNKIRFERRQFPRLNSCAGVEYTILKKESLPDKKAVTKNISAGGICLIVYEKIEPESILDLTINLEDINHIVNAKGRVVWSSCFTISSDSIARYDLGIEFIEIKESDHEKISQHVISLIH